MTYAVPEWRPVPGFEGLYSITPTGVVRSEITVDGRGHALKPNRILKHRRSHGYAIVSLRRNGKSLYRYIHRLVLEAYVGPCPPEEEGRHLNGDKTDNRRENLAWGTRAENVGDSLRHGTHRSPRGENNPRARLTSSDVVAIRAALLEGAAVVSLAKQYNIASASIRGIKNGTLWRHVPS